MRDRESMGGTGQGVPKILFEGKKCFIAREGRITELDQLGPWTDRHTELAREYKVNALLIGETDSMRADARAAFSPQRSDAVRR